MHPWAPYRHSPRRCPRSWTRRTTTRENTRGASSALNMPPPARRRGSPCPAVLVATPHDDVRPEISHQQRDLEENETRIPDGGTTAQDRQQHLRGEELHPEQERRSHEKRDAVEELSHGAPGVRLCPASGRRGLHAHNVDIGDRPLAAPGFETPTDR